MRLLDSCPICSASEWNDFLEAEGFVVHIGRLFLSEAEALKAPRGNLLLSLCGKCGYIGNRIYEEIVDVFAPGYDASMHHSRVYHEFLCNLADDLVNHYKLRGKSVLEVASGPGFFLRLMLQHGCGQGIGVDPALDVEGPDWEGGAPITWIRDFYDERYSELAVDFILCRQALHTIPVPKMIVDSVRRAIGNRIGIPVYFEVVNAANLFGKGIVWQLLYEYRSYFTARSLAWLFRECGFDVIRAAPCYDEGQYLSIEALPANGGASAAQEIDQATPDVKAFGNIFRQKVSSWRDRLNELKNSGRQVVVWGAAGRGITFLNLIDPDRQIRYIVEINPARQGKFIPGNGALVVAPEFLKELKPDAIILTNTTYELEIRSQVASMGLNSEFLLA